MTTHDSSPDTSFNPEDLEAADSKGGNSQPDLNPFDPERLRLSQDFDSSVGVQKVLLTVPVRKPDRQWFFRVRPGEEWRLPTAIIELKEERETYLVDPALRDALPGDVSFKMIYTAINRQGVVFLWPVKLPDGMRKQDQWSRSAHEAAELAEGQWVRMAANMSLGAYEVFQASSDAIPDPEWPDKTLGELLEIAFKEKFIRSLGHEVVKQLLGKV